MQSSPLLLSRVSCPCCGYPTLPHLNAYEVCELCNWEDDGQGDADAGVVRGGWNSDYSLTEARENFKQYRVMYAPGRDQRIIDGDSPLEYETKGLLIDAFAHLPGAAESERSTCEAEITRLEKILQDETTRQVQTYEQRHSGAEPPNHCP